MHTIITTSIKFYCVWNINWIIYSAARGRPVGRGVLGARGGALLGPNRAMARPGFLLFFYTYAALLGQSTTSSKPPISHECTEQDDPHAAAHDYRRRRHPAQASARRTASPSYSHTHRSHSILTNARTHRRRYSIGCTEHN